MQWVRMVTRTKGASLVRLRFRFRVREDFNSRGYGKPSIGAAQTTGRVGPLLTPLADAEILALTPGRSMPDGAVMKYLLAPEKVRTGSCRPPQ